MPNPPQDYEALARKLEELLKIASPEPWQPFGDSTLFSVRSGTRVLDAKGYSVFASATDPAYGDARPRANAELASRARNLVPFVVAALRSLAEAEQAQDAADECPDCEDLLCEVHAELYIQATEKRRAALALARSLEEET